MPLQPWDTNTFSEGAGIFFPLTRKRMTIWSFRYYLKRIIPPVPPSNVVQEASLNQRLRDPKHLCPLPPPFSYFSRVSLGYFVDREQNPDIAKSNPRQPLACWNPQGVSFVSPAKPQQSHTSHPGVGSVGGWPDPAADCPQHLEF